MRHRKIIVNPYISYPPAITSPQLQTYIHKKRSLIISHAKCFIVSGTTGTPIAGTMMFHMPVIHPLRKAFCFVSLCAWSRCCRTIYTYSKQSQHIFTTKSYSPQTSSCQINSTEQNNTAPGSYNRKQAFQTCLLAGQCGMYRPSKTWLPAKHGGCRTDSQS